MLTDSGKSFKYDKKNLSSFIFNNIKYVKIIRLEKFQIFKVVDKNLAGHLQWTNGLFANEIAAKYKWGKSQCWKLIFFYAESLPTNIDK